MSGSHEPHETQGPSTYEPPKDIDNMVLFIPVLLGISIATTVFMAVIWF